MELDATITGTKQGMYVACIDEERLEYDCDEACPSCPYPCRVLLEKEGQNLEKGRRVRIEIPVSVIDAPEKLASLLAVTFVVSAVVVHVIKMLLISGYSGVFSSILSGIITSSLVYLILKSRKEKSKGSLRKGRIIRVYSQKGGAFGG